MNKKQILAILFVILIILTAESKIFQKNIFSYFKNVLAQNVVNTLRVFSNPISGIAIVAEDPIYSGTTNYTKQNTSTISTWLIAQPIKDQYSFCCWEGCDKVEGNRCFVNIANGLSQWVTAYYKPNTLKVLSNLNVHITASDPRYSGTTNYYVTSTSIITATLTAPLYKEAHTFCCWHGCDSVDKNNCKVNVANGMTQEVFAHYVANNDVYIDSIDVYTFLCKNNQLNLSFLSEYLQEFLQKHPDRPAPSTTAATEFYNKVASSTCPETNINHPVKIIAKANCEGSETQYCLPAKLKLDIQPKLGFNTDGHNETYSTSTPYNGEYPKTIEFIIDGFSNAYDFDVTASLVDKNDQIVNDYKTNGKLNSMSTSFRVFYYLCNYGFSARSQTDWSPTNTDYSLHLKRPYEVFSNTDSPTRFWLNTICSAQIGQ